MEQIGIIAHETLVDTKRNGDICDKGWTNLQAMIKKTTPRKRKKAMARKKIVADEKLIDHVVFPIKTVIAVVIWVGGLISMYFALRVDIKQNTELATDAKTLANETKERVEKYDLSVVIFKVNSMENNIKEIKTSVDGIQKDINRIATSK